MYFFYFSSIATQHQNREEGKYGKESNDGIKDELLKSLIDGEIELKFE